MRRFLSVWMLVSGLLVAGGAMANTTYTYTGTTYDPTSFTNYTSCNAPTCGTFTTSMQVTGTFTVASPLPANQSLTDITAQLVSWSFNNGIATVSSTGNVPFIYSFQVATDSSGNISDAFIGVNNWQTTVGVNSYYNSVVVFPNSFGGSSRGDVALQCSTMASATACAVANSTPNTSFSEALSLSSGTWPTPAAAPTATTDPATSITANDATLNGTVNDNGAQTTVDFEYGTTVGYGASATASPSTISAGAGSTAVTAALTGLTCNTTYHFRVNANNGTGGIINGSDATFTTSACATPPAPQPIPTLSEWAQIIMMLAMIATTGFYGWRMKQR